MKFVALLGFLFLALSPSFLDWEQSPSKRLQFVDYYVFALALIYAGLFGKK